MKNPVLSDLDLVGLIYDAAIAPERWPDFLNALNTRLGNKSCFLHSMDERVPEAGILVNVGIDPGPLADYGEYYYQLDPGLVDILARGEGAITGTQLLFSDSEFAKSEFYNDCIRRVDAFYCAGINVAQSAGRATIVALQRKFGEPGYTKADYALMAVLAPHLKRAMQIGRLLAKAGAERSAMADLLDRLPHGTVLLDERGRILAMNRRALALLRAGDGLAETGGELWSHDAGETRNLRAAILAAVATGQGQGMGAGGTLRISRPSGAPPYQVLVTPLRDKPPGLDLAETRVRAAVVIADPLDVPAPPAESLREWFGLTPSEARVATELARGQRMEDIATALNLSPHTVRTHIKRILAKLEVGNQGQAALKLASSPGWAAATLGNGGHPRAARAAD